MSETTAPGGRARRRALRQAGPPASDDQTAVELRITEPAVAPATTGEEKQPTPVEDAKPAAAKSDTPATGSESPAEDAGEAESAEDAAEPKSKSRRVFDSLGPIGVAAAVVALISTLLLIGSGGVFFYHQNHADALESRRTEYVQVARQAVINLMTVKGDTADQDIDRILAVSSGSLKDEYAQNRDVYKKVFEQVKVQSTGTVLDTAIESDDADSAKVLVLAQQTVSNASSKDPQQKDYRFRVTVTRDSKGVTASNLEFVP
ncbi:hypothetical protein [Nocardia sp. NPDC020380]|uniref:hypothetical protein n=1 Tax=Nocardia sp. NPDC020380 TaxID=3364309 RepID=UPI0037BB2ED2